MDSKPIASYPLLSFLNRSILLFCLLLASASHAASQLSPAVDGTVDGFSLPGISPAGWPNFENEVSVRWTKKGRGTSQLHAFSSSEDILLNLSPSDSRILQGGSYQLRATFNSLGELLDGSIKVTGVIKNGDVDGMGVLMTAILSGFAFTENMIGFNTTNIDCPDFSFCTSNESAYLSLASGGFDTSLKQYSSVALAVTTLPIPDSMWLLGSGLLGFVGIARRRNHSHGKLTAQFADET